MGSVLRRGLGAGAFAGLAAGLFFLAAGEPLIDGLLTNETRSDAVEVFTRAVQQLGLIAGTLLYGASVGGVFSVVFAFVAPRLRTGSAWNRAIRLGAVTFLTVWLVPFLKYPSNPPAVGDPQTVHYRTGLYLAMLGLSVLASVGAYLGARRLEERGLPPHVREPLAATAYLAAVGLSFMVLPGNPDSISIPAALLWNARLVSAGGQFLLWFVLVAVLGVLVEREGRRVRREAPAVRFGT